MLPQMQPRAGLILTAPHPPIIFSMPDTPSPTPVRKIQKGLYGHHVAFEDLTYNQDWLMCRHNTGFSLEEPFATAYRKAWETGSWHGGDIHWRAHTVAWAASMASKLKGDFVECGTNRGGTAMLVLEYLGREAFAKRKFYLLDTYQGLDEAESKALELEQFAGVYNDCWEEVQTRFRPYPEVELVRGTVPGTLDAIKSKEIAYLHIDLNAAKPEQAALKRLWPRLVAGAPVVLDDYAWVTCAAQKKAHDKFAEKHGLKILSLPTGQGLLIKPQGPSKFRRRLAKWLQIFHK